MECEQTDLPSEEIKVILNTNRQTYPECKQNLLQVQVFCFTQDIIFLPYRFS